jgi:hypothetical protein
LYVGIILAITAYFIYEIWQLDVKAKEDNQGCMEDTTMGFVNPENSRKVCKL